AFEKGFPPVQVQAAFDFFADVTFRAGCGKDRADLQLKERFRVRGRWLTKPRGGGQHQRKAREGFGHCFPLLEGGELGVVGIAILIGVEGERKMLLVGDPRQFGFRASYGATAFPSKVDDVTPKETGSGGGGIRTREGVTPAGFQDRFPLRLRTKSTKR